MVQEIIEKIIKIGGDDFDDGFEFDFDFFVFLDIEDVVFDVVLEFDGGEQWDQVLEDESLLVFEGEEMEIVMSFVLEMKKRKVEDVENEGEQDEEVVKVEKK